MLRKLNVAVVAAFAAIVLAPSVASATAPTNASVQFGLPTAATTNAGAETEYTITFTTSDAINAQPGSAIVLNAAGMGLAPGTVFPPSAPNTPTGQGGAFYTLSVGGSNVAALAPVQRSNANQTVVIPTFGTGINAMPGDVITLTIGYTTEGKVENPPSPCSCRLAIATLSPGEVPPNTPIPPAEFGLTAAYDVVQGPGDLDVQTGNNQTTAVGTPFSTLLKAKLVDGTGTPVEGATITFTAPATGPSGTFAGGMNGGLVFQASTDANGIATASVLTANGTPGMWQVTASTTTPNVAPVKFNLTNTTAQASQISVDVTPSEITADGVSTTKATATVSDQFGNPINDRNVTFDSDGDQQISAVQELGAGRYRVTITSTTDVGTFTITATDTDAGLIDMDTFEQLEDTQAPKTTIIENPGKKFKKAKARFTFEANQIDVDFFECSLDGSNFQKCSSPKTYRVKRGKHEFKVRATDTNGNTGPAASYSFKRIKKK